MPGKLYLFEKHEKGFKLILRRGKTLNSREEERKWRPRKQTRLEQFQIMLDTSYIFGCAQGDRFV